MAFCTRYGHFKYQVMSFSLSNMPASFQDYINKILAKKLDIFVLVYLDNILIYIKNSGQDQFEAVRLVFEQLWNYFFYANLKRYQFYQEGMRFLSYVVLSRGIRMKDKKIKAVRGQPEPKSVRGIQVFIGLANFYWRFIQGFSKITAPLTSMLKTSASDTDGAVNDQRQNRSDEIISKTTKCKSTKSSSGSGFLTPKTKIAFNRLRQAFTKAPILQHFDPERHI